jgi:glycosyltransferase involved in cell wall biosynthesis
MNNPRVSVIIPCYNSENYIKKTIDSVLIQTYKNIEIIVVNDGSTDSSLAVLKTYGKSIKIIEHDSCLNKGQSASLNLGIVSSNSEYVAFLDSDDVFLPHKIEIQVAFMEKFKNIGLVYTNGYAIDENDNNLYKIYNKKHIEYNNPNCVLLDFYFFPSCILLRRNVLEKAGFFDEKLRAAQDHDLALRICEITSIAYLDEILFCYRRHKNSISAKNAKKRWKNGYIILNNARKRYPYKFRTLLFRLAVLNFRLGQCYFEESKYFRFFLMMIAAGLCDPYRALRVLMKKEKITSQH